MHTCPRRIEGPLYKEKNKDNYRLPNNTCSYCGSLNPDELMKRLEIGDIELGPTDKSYKIYIRNSGGEIFKQRYRTDDKPFISWDSPEHTWIIRERQETKFYFQHLSEIQKQRFVELFNEKKLKIGYPGYFYVFPYFMKLVK